MVWMAHPSPSKALVTSCSAMRRNRMHPVALSVSRTARRTASANTFSVGLPLGLPDSPFFQVTCFTARKMLRMRRFSRLVEVLV